MLKSPTSILNSIQKMKSNLRNDKEQLRIIKTNFNYLDHCNQTNDSSLINKIKTRSKSLLNINHNKSVLIDQSSLVYSKVNDSKVHKSQSQVIKQNSKINKQNDMNNQNTQNSNLSSNQSVSLNKPKLLTQQNNKNKNDIYMKNSQVNKQSIKSNRVYIQQNTQNILKDISKFKKNQPNRVFYPNQQNNITNYSSQNREYKNKQNYNKQLNKQNINNKQTQFKQQAQIKQIKLRYQNQIKQLKLNHQNQKFTIQQLNNQKLEQLQTKYKKELTQMKEYIALLQNQLNDLNSVHSHQKLMDRSCQMSQSRKSNKLSPYQIQQKNQNIQTNNIQTQTQQLYPNNHLISITEQYNLNQSDSINNVQTSSILMRQSSEKMNKLQSKIKQQASNQQQFSYQSKNNQYSSSCHIVSSSSNIQQEQKINEQNKFNNFTQSNNFTINGLNLNHNNLIQQLCIKYFGTNNLSNQSNQISKQQLNNNSSSTQQIIQFNNQQRSKYQHIINKLLQQNTKLHLKLQKLYVQTHAQNFNKQKSQLFKNFNINYKTVSSHNQDQINQQSSISERSKVLNKYFTTKQNCKLQNNPKFQTNKYGNTNSAQSSSQFQSRIQYPSRVSDFNYKTYRDESNQNRHKQSIIYKISNVMSASMLKQSKNSSRSKIPSKNPPIKVKNGINVSIPHQRRLKTQVSEISSKFASGNYDSNQLGFANYNSNSGQSIDLIGLSKAIESQQRIPTMKQKMKKQPSFKFYDDQSIVEQKMEQKEKNSLKNMQIDNKKKENRIQIWQQDSQNEIKDDEIKMKTIKNFKCYQNQ